MAAFMGHDWIDRHTGEWVRAGLVSSDQAEAIRHFEHHTDTAEAERLSVGAEVASYLGSVLALMGGAIMVGRRWDTLGIAGRLGIAAAIAAVGFVAGRWLVRQGESAMTRLGGFMWAIGAGGVALFVGLSIDRWGPSEESWTPIGIGVVLFGVGLALWRNRERPLQFITAGVGFVMAAFGVGELTTPPAWLGGVVFIVVGLLVATPAAIDRVVPRTVAIAAGAAAAFGGAMALSDFNRHLGPFVALAVAAAMIVFALVDRTTVLLVLGVIGTLISTQALLMTTFDGAVSSMIVSVIGLAIVVIAVTRSSRHHPTNGGPTPHAA